MSLASGNGAKGRAGRLEWLGIVAPTDAILETLMTGMTTEIVLTPSRGSAIAMRVVAVENGGDDPCQLLRAIAVFETVGRA